MEQTKNRRITALVIGGALTVALVGGGIFGLASIAQGRERAAQQQAAQERADAAQDALEDKLVAVGAEAVEKQQEADDAAWVQHLAELKEAEEKRVADALAAEQQRIADEAQATAKAATKAPVKSSASGGGGGGGGAGSPGSPIPFVSDPNEAGGGHYDTTQCASGSGSTINGVPTCD